MQASEYVEKATAYITDPVQALAVRRELEEHLREAADELVGKGIDQETAELVAVARMGSPESLARDLAEAHHRHLPWRYYLAVIPLFILLVSPPVGPRFFREIASFWYVVLAATIMPPRKAIVRVFSQFRVDAAAKFHWLRNQSWRAPVLSGLAVGGMTGLLFALGAIFAQNGLVSGPAFLLLILFLPAVASLGGLLLSRHQAPVLKTAGVAGLVLSVINLLTMVGMKSGDAVALGFTLSGGYTLLMFGAAWAILRLEASGRLVRVRT